MMDIDVRAGIGLISWVL